MTWSDSVCLEPLSAHRAAGSTAQAFSSSFLLLRHAPALLGGLLLQQAPGWRGLVSVTPEPKQSPAEMGDTWDHVRTQHRVTDHQTHWLMTARKKETLSRLELFSPAPEISELR